MKICNGTFSYNGQVGKHAFCAGLKEGGADSCQVRFLHVFILYCTGRISSNYIYLSLS